MKTNAESEEDPIKVKLEFNYEFLEDKKECRKQWKIKEHPLALMVS